MKFIEGHEFGIMDQFEENKGYYEYEPEKYNCISVDMKLVDYVIDNYTEEWAKIKTYLSVSSQTFYGLDESGVTIIPPESLKLFRDIMIDANSKISSTQLIHLIHKIEKAIRYGKYLIHFGI